MKIKRFDSFITENSSNYQIDEDNVLDILKNTYGLGDISPEYFSDFENSDYYDSSIKSDQEYAEKLYNFIDPFGENKDYDDEDYEY
jgi:hypothetical protein